jgi:hypothetical protein
MFGVKIVFNHADYRLLSRRALQCLQEYSEVNLFIRGIIPLLGFRSTVVTYDRVARFAGESKYPLRKMLSLAINGITSFSAVPLRFIAVLGVVVSIASIAMVAWILWIKLFGCAGLGVIGDPYLFSRRHTAAEHRRAWRIHCQNLFGNQATAQVLRRRSTVSRPAC